MSSNAWDLLANYESFDLIKRNYRDRHGRTPSTEHAREVAAPFIHARSYFRAAQEGELTVKPLLLYYGVLSLSRGLALTLIRGLREANLAPSHGLTAKDWGTELRQVNFNFAALKVSVNAKGSFMKLGEATSFRSLLKNNSSAVNFTHQIPPVPADTEISLGDLVSRLPALRDHHERWRGGTLCAPVTIQPVNNTDTVIRLTKANCPWVTRPNADAVFQGTAFAFDSETSDNIAFRGPNDVQALPGITDYAYPGTLNIGNLWLTALYPSGTQLSKISTLFALSYILGMLVRYHPTQWTALIRGQIADAALPTLATAIDLIENEYPQLVVEFLA